MGISYFNRCKYECFAGYNVVIADHRNIWCWYFIFVYTGNIRHIGLSSFPEVETLWNSLPSSSVFSVVQLVLSFIRPFLKCAWFSDRPVSNMATLTPLPENPRFHSISACKAVVICLGTARNSLRLLWRTCECQNAPPCDTVFSYNMRLSFNERHFL